MQVDLNIQNPAGGNSSDDDIHNRIKTGIADELLQFLSIPDKINLEKAKTVHKNKTASKRKMKRENNVNQSNELKVDNSCNVNNTLQDKNVTKKNIDDHDKIIINDSNTLINIQDNNNNNNNITENKDQENESVKQAETEEEEFKRHVERMGSKMMNVLKDAFEVFDDDGDGTISYDELGVVMSNMGEAKTDEELKKMIDSVDADGSGAIDWQEFIIMMGREDEDPNSSSEFVKAVKSVFVNTITAPRNAEEAAAARQHRRMYMGNKRKNDTTFRDPNPIGGTYKEYLEWCEYEGYGNVDTRKPSEKDTKKEENELIAWDVSWKRDTWWGEDQDHAAIRFQRSVHRICRFLQKKDSIDNEEFQILREEAAVKNLHESIIRLKGTFPQQLLNRAEWLLDKARRYIQTKRDKFEKKQKLLGGSMPSWWTEKVIQRQAKIKMVRIAKHRAVLEALKNLRKLRIENGLNNEVHEDSLENPCFLLVDDIIVNSKKAAGSNLHLQHTLNPILRPPPPKEERWTKDINKVSYQSEVGYDKGDPLNPLTKYAASKKKAITKGDKEAMEIVGHFMNDASTWMTEKSIKKRTNENKLAFAKRLARLYMHPLKNLPKSREVNSAIEEIFNFIEKILPPPGTVETSAEKKERIDGMLYGNFKLSMKKKGEQESEVDIFSRWSGISQEELYKLKLAAKKLPVAEQPWFCLVCMNANKQGTAKCSVCFRKPGTKATSWKLGKHRPRNPKLGIKYFHTHNYGSYKQTKKWDGIDVDKIEEERKQRRLSPPNSDDPSTKKWSSDEIFKKSLNVFGDKLPSIHEKEKLQKKIKEIPKNKTWKPFLIIDEMDLDQVESFEHIGRKKRDWLTGELRSRRHKYHLLY